MIGREERDLLLVHLLASGQLSELQEATGFLCKVLLVICLSAGVFGPLCWKPLHGENNNE